MWYSVSDTKGPYGVDNRLAVINHMLTGFTVRQ